MLNVKQNKTECFDFCLNSTECMNSYYNETDSSCYIVPVDHNLEAYSSTCCTSFSKSTFQECEAKSIETDESNKVDDVRESVSGVVPTGMNKMNSI